MLKVRFEYDLPEYDPSKHDPDKVFGFLTYRGVHYAKWIDLISRADKIWKIKCCLLYTSPSPRDQRGSRMPSSA